MTFLHKIIYTFWPTVQYSKSFHLKFFSNLNNKGTSLFVRLSVCPFVRLSVCPFVRLPFLQCCLTLSIYNSSHDHSVNSSLLGRSSYQQNLLSDGFCLSGRQKNLKKALSEKFIFTLSSFFLQNLAKLILTYKRGLIKQDRSMMVSSCRKKFRRTLISILPLCSFHSPF